VSLSTDVGFKNYYYPEKFLNELLMTEAKNLLHEKIDEFNRTFDFDQRLFAHAVRVNFAYCDALFHAEILTRLEAERVRNGLQTILKRADYDKNYFLDAAADIHSFIETRLIGLIGEAGEKISVGRNRHDQSATALRLWLREKIEEISKCARDLQTVLIEAGERHKEAILPAYANSRKSQPILWAHWCLAYFEMFARDRDRLEEVWRRVNILPLGATNVAGTSIEIDREEVARALQFEGVSANSLDAASDTDYAIETVGACALLMLHISRLAEDLIRYNSTEFGFLELIDAPSDFPLVGKTSEALELIRGRSAGVLGHQTALFSLTKNLSLGSHKDTQEIYSAIFDTVDTVCSGLQIILLIFKNTRVNADKTLAAAIGDYPARAELFDYLVQRNVSLKTARISADEIVLYAAAQGKSTDELSLEEFQKFSESIGDDIFHHLSLEQMLASKNQVGGTAPERVFEALEQAKESLERE